MGKALCILVCLAVAGAACAKVEVRIWVTNEPPPVADATGRVRPLGRFEA